MRRRPVASHGNSYPKKLGEDGAHLPRRHVWPESLCEWTIKLPYPHGLKCHDMIFLGGQVSLDKSAMPFTPTRCSRRPGRP